MENIIRKKTLYLKSNSHLLIKWTSNLMYFIVYQNFITEINEFENNFQTAQNNKKVKGYPAV